MFIFKGNYKNLIGDKSAFFNKVAYFIIPVFGFVVQFMDNVVDS